MLRALARGEAPRAQALLHRVYEELRRLADAQMAKERVGHTLQPTALVHEAWLRLVGDEPVDWAERGHFYGAAARAMRRILIDHARRRRAAKRGGGGVTLPLSPALEAAEHRFQEIVAVDEALSRMEERDPRGADVVRLRFFAGLADADVARVLGISERTVRREWLYARARLFRDLGGETRREGDEHGAAPGNRPQEDLRGGD